MALRHYLIPLLLMHPQLSVIPILKSTIIYYKNKNAFLQHFRSHYYSCSVVPEFIALDNDEYIFLKLHKNLNNQYFYSLE